MEWITQNKQGGFSSYYLFDNTNTRTLVRIRLELGRGSSENDPGYPAILINKNRAIGFTSQPLTPPDEIRENVYWNMDFNGRLRLTELLKDESYNVVRNLRSRPRLGDRVYDLSILSSGSYILFSYHPHHKGGTVAPMGEAKLPVYTSPDGNKIPVTIEHLKKIAEEAINSESEVLLRSTEQENESNLAKILLEKAGTLRHI